MKLALLRRRVYFENSSCAIMERSVLFEVQEKIYFDPKAAKVNTVCGGGGILNVVS